jgi:TonB family protein
MKRHTGVSVGLVLVACSLSHAIAADEAADSAPLASAPADTIAVEVFRAPQIRSFPSRNFYPGEEVRDGREGWVVLNMMIDPKGRPYEVMVADSSGNPAFEKAALRAVDQIGFEPARRGTTPTDSSFIFKMKFSIRGMANGATPAFAAAYGRFTGAIKAGDKAKADEALERVHPENLYEEAYANFGKFQYHYKWGTPAEQRVDLNRAVAGEDKPNYLPKDVFAAALYTRFGLEVAAHDYGTALETWNVLEPFALPAMRKELEGIVGQLRAAQLSSQPILQSATIEENNRWSTTLFRSRFHIVVADGAVSEIKLRCARQYLFFKYEPGLEYSIGSKSDHCGLEVVGDNGTKFDLVQ